MTCPFRDRADAEVLALAAVRGYAVGSDDRRVQTEARRLPGVSAIGSVDLLVTHLRGILFYAAGIPRNRRRTTDG
jgi:hypothetical protein